MFLTGVINKSNMVYGCTALSYLATAFYYISLIIPKKSNDYKPRAIIGYSLLFLCLICTIFSIVALFTGEANTSSKANNVQYSEYDFTNDGYIYEEAEPYMENPNSLHYGGHTYYIFSSSEIDTFSDAEKYCENLGGHLAIITDDAENTALYNYVFLKRELKSAYFGLTNAGYEVWKWVDGSLLTYRNWRDNEPYDANGKEHYALFYNPDPKKTAPDNKWWSGDFGKNPDTVNFICEWDYE